MRQTEKKPLVAIACGGTGGHLFPGLAVADHLLEGGCDVMAMISPKDVDQKAVHNANRVQVKILPAVGLVSRNYLSFLTGFWRSYSAARNIFSERPPLAVLAMGGFTSAPPIHAGKSLGAATFLHESNTVPGRANRWLARFVHQAFVGFPSTVSRLKHPKVRHTGTPVRSQFKLVDKRDCRQRMGLDPERDVLLTMGGSQGASGVNQLVLSALPILAKELPHWQYVHLTGDRDFEEVQAAYRRHSLKAVVLPFSTDMEILMAAATVAISRSGASSLAELAAMHLPSVLVPYPTAADNHQYFNARAFSDAGAAHLIEQRTATPEALWDLLRALALDTAGRTRMADAVARWHKPGAAADIAESMFRLMRNLHGDLVGIPGGAPEKVHPKNIIPA